MDKRNPYRDNNHNMSIIANKLQATLEAYIIASGNPWIDLSASNLAIYAMLRSSPRERPWCQSKRNQRLCEAYRRVA